ncbi:hypothetical protein FG386_001967 [Cryptosporidium ryanae]|uniref:uncharacterized protein n=1 Tax=Cryptosporidium ryanae TaxID=515981 RepID=UPI003519DBC1|nr:hypothetical protein FG386_001967 [Cryptosporidium ryanae]
MLYKSFCYFNLSDCWRSYVDLSQKYEWRQDLSKLAEKCMQEEINKNIKDELNSELYHSVSEVVSGIHAVVSDIETACKSLGLYNCTKEAKLVNEELEQVFIISDFE